jgi:mannose-6-phosphate isomerase-like protein (cupin superfamily)
MSLNSTELRAFATRLANEPERWAHLLDANSDERVYELIWDDEDVNAWIIVWNEDSDTGFHDHDESAAGITVIAGAVREDRLSLGGLPRVRLFSEGDTFTVEPSAIHRVLHAGSRPAVTIHAYSPPLRRMGSYSVTEDGVLERESQSFEVELRAPVLA